MFEALVDRLVQFLAKKECRTHSETPNDEKFKALVDGLACTLLYVKEETLDDTLGNVEAQALADELPDVLRDVETERF